MCKLPPTHISLPYSMALTQIHVSSRSQMLPKGRRCFMKEEAAKLASSFHVPFLLSLWARYPPPTAQKAKDGFETSLFSLWLP